MEWRGRVSSAAAWCLTRVQRRELERVGGSAQLPAVSLAMQGGRVLLQGHCVHGDRERVVIACDQSDRLSCQQEEEEERLHGLLGMKRGGVCLSQQVIEIANEC